MTSVNRRNKGIMKGSIVYCLALILTSPPLASAFATPPSHWGLLQSSSSSSSSKRTTCRSAQAATSTTDAVSASNLELLSDRGRTAVEHLLAHDKDGAQAHVYADWPAPGTDDNDKRRLADQLADLDSSYPGGLSAYLTKAKTLLKESADGTNPFADYEASVPDGELLRYGDEDGSTCRFADAEAAGLQASGQAVFVLVAGGLGERLGYSGIKLSLDTNLCTQVSYLELYCQYILALQYGAQQRCNDNSIRIPLVIMTSGDTDASTRQLLEDHANFGMDDTQIQIVMQEKVAALKDGAAGLALDDDDRWTVQTKPHGHGDVHQLLAPLVEDWEAQGKSHVVFLQDTNALVINSVVPTLGVSVMKGFHMNSICIPRLAGEAAGAIARLEHKSDPNKSLTINVEYNQLDPLLRTQGDGKGDVADPETGYSPFPGNANNLIIEVSAYAKTLRGEDQGVVVEFVNPKYKDTTRTEFKKPTRLECMMQDIPKLFQKEMGADVNIGFTMFDRWFTFSPAKNALDAGQEAVQGGSSAPGTMSSAESDMYIQNQKKLKHLGATLDVTEEDDLVTVAGIPVTPGPRILLYPAFGISQKDYTEKVRGELSLTQRSSLVLEGQHLTIQGLELDGALVIRASDESHVTVDGLKVQNEGWEFEELDANTEYPEAVQIRGYTMKKKETREYIITEPGNFVIDASGDLKKVD